MRQGAAWLAALWLCLLTGCVSKDGGQRPAWENRFHSFNLEKTSNVVQLDVAVIERRVGDPYINQEVWGYTDEQVVDLERLALLEENGFRLGRIVGTTPAGLQRMLTSERSCANPRCFLLPSGKDRAIVLGSIQPRCCCTLFTSGQPVEVELEQAQCSLLIRPTLTSDGQLTLHFTPRVEYGESTKQIHAARDLSGWVLEVQKPEKICTDLSWDVALTSNEYLIIGGLLQRPTSLGFQCFVERNAYSPVQRLLVIRAVHSRSRIDAEIADLPARTSEGAPLPLALQAIRPTVRGSGP